MSSKKTEFMTMHDWVGTDGVRREEISENFKNVENELRSRGLNPQWFGAVPGGVIDCTLAFKACFEQAKQTREKVIIPQGTYLVTDTILDWAPTGSGPNGFTIEGNGISADAVKIKFTPPTMSTPLIRLANIKSMLIRDLTLESVAQNNRQGIAIILGDGDETSAVTNFKAYNLNIRYFDVGVDARYGWLNAFYSPTFRYNNTALISAMNSVDYYSIISEGNGTGVWVNGGGTVNFFGGCVETNDLGFRISKGLDVNLNGVYMEANTAIGHIMAGTDDDAVQSLTITGGSVHYSNPMVFDKINRLKINGLSGYDGNLTLTITDNVKSYIGDFMHYAFGPGNMHSGIISNRKNAESDFPFFSTDFRNLSSLNSATETFIDAAERISISTVNGTVSVDTSDYLTGNKSVKFTSNALTVAASTYALFRFYFDETKLNSRMFAVWRAKISTNSPSFIRQYYAVYNNSAGGTTSVQVYNINPTIPIPLIGGKYVSEFDPFDISDVLSRSDFVSLARIEVRVYNISSGTGVIATGTETINIDSVDIYNSALPMHPYQNKSDQVNKAEFTAYSLNTDAMTLGGRRVVYGTAPPIAGAHKQGDLVINPGSAGDNFGWMCVVDGTPGIWESVGVIGNSLFTLRSPHGLLFKFTANDSGQLVSSTSSVVYDFFERANSTTSIGTANSGQVWSNAIGTWGINSNVAYCVSDADSDIATISNSLTDYSVLTEASGYFIDTSNRSQPCVVVRYVNTTNYFYLQLDTSIILKKRVANVETTLALKSVNPVNDNYYAIKTVCNGGNIKIYLDGVLQLDYTMSADELATFGTASGVGLRLRKAGTVAGAARWRKLIVDSL